MYTIKQLSTLAGVTPRTLHYYDEIGLLTPSKIGENGYRYYGQEEILRLQQILLFRKMEMPLKEIKQLVNRNDFDILHSLENHKNELQKKIHQLIEIKKTVEETIICLKGNKEMPTNKLFSGFTEEQQSEYEKEAMQMYDPKTVQDSAKKWKSYSADMKQKILEESKTIYLDMANAMEKGASSLDAQDCVERWRRNMDYFWTPSLDQMLGLGELYNEDPRFHANINEIKPGLAEFLRESIRIYVKRQVNKNRSE